MIVGDPSVFAIESAITYAYQRLSFRALGLFVVYVSRRRYGVHSPDATMLACSFDAVGRRIDRRGTHTAPFATEPDAGQIADAAQLSLYALDQEDQRFFGIPGPEFHKLICSNQLLWAPDGDEAFDDGSRVLQFDVGDRVRLIAFRSREQGYRYDPTTLSDVWLTADDFYHVLQQWHDAFEAEWAGTPKTPEDEHG